jgi:acyl-CoA dehydrogenase
LVNGEKIWFSTAQVANKMLLLARTTPRSGKAQDRRAVAVLYQPGSLQDRVRLIHKMGRHAVDSNMLFIQDLWIPEEDRIGATICAKA